MKHILTLTLLFFLFIPITIAQKIEESYLAKNNQQISIDAPSFSLFDNNFYNNNLFFFGFIHGSATPQLMDYELLVHLHQKGVRYYAPEIDYSHAYFLNEYLNTGNELYLDYVLKNFVRKRTPQDASLQFKEKWKKIYQFNKAQKQDDKIKIIGTDSGRFNIYHIAQFAPNEPTGITLIDSLKYFKIPKPIKGTSIWSGKNISKSGKNWGYFFPENPISLFEDKFLEHYKSNKETCLKAFGKHKEEVSKLIEIYEKNKGIPRESTIFNNYRKLVIPLIEKGEKIYSNFGFAHVLQEKINGYPYLANRLKDSLDTKIKLTTILGLMANSEVLKERKPKKGEKMMIKGYKFHDMYYEGYKTSKNMDGDSFLEKAKGIKLLKKIAEDNDITLFKLDANESPFNNSLFFINLKKYRESLFRKGNWNTEKGSSTTDYCQYILFIQNSKNNIPFPPN